MSTTSANHIGPVSRNGVWCRNIVQYDLLSPAIRLIANISSSHSSRTHTANGTPSRGSRSTTNRRGSLAGQWPWHRQPGKQEGQAHREQGADQAEQCDGAVGHRPEGDPADRL
jgi:hypothetical protein